MSSEITLVSSQEMILHEYCVQWEIKDPLHLRTKSCKTPPFSPILNFDLSYHFDIMYHEFNHGMENVTDRSTYEIDVASIFKLTFVKTSGSAIPPSWKMNVDVIVKYSSGSLFKRYNRNDVSVRNMTAISFPICVKKRNGYLDNLGLGPEMSSIYNRGSKISNGLIIDCKLVINDCLTSFADYNKEKQCREQLGRFVNDFSTIYDSTSLSDIEFKFGNKSLQAHKSILGAHSPVFLKMFTHDFLESKNNVVFIHDSSYEAFKCFLKFLYCGEVEDKSWPSIKELYKIADKYDVGVLKQMCLDLCISIISSDTFCEILELGCMYDDFRLQRLAIKFAKENVQELIIRDDWNQLVETHPRIGYKVMLSIVQK